MDVLRVIGLLLVGGGISAVGTLLFVKGAVVALGVGAPMLLVGAALSLIGRARQASVGAGPAPGRPDPGPVPVPPSEAPTPIEAQPPGRERRTPIAPGRARVDTLDADVGESTVAQTFVPDYSAQAMPGLTDIYRHIQAGLIRGYLLVVSGPDRGAGIPIKGDPVGIGRDQGCEFALRDPGVSHRQASIAVQGEQVYLTDANSRNGTYVNNERVASVPLSNCDVIAFGSTKILVTLGV